MIMKFKPFSTNSMSTTIGSSNNSSGITFEDGNEAIIIYGDAEFSHNNKSVESIIYLLNIFNNIIEHPSMSIISNNLTDIDKKSIMNSFDFSKEFVISSKNNNGFKFSSNQSKFFIDGDTEISHNVSSFIETKNLIFIFKEILNILSK